MLKAKRISSELLPSNSCTFKFAVDEKENLVIKHETFWGQIILVF